ncbi:xylulose kinase 2-like [Salvia splendens]|uniref:xylulose kinase 2-like n=1 Tax=Salvia splendens TaxID=180675 RepID=UPI001C259E0F|nr:xylulose kinase 2-like [Salvia splendens]
MDDFSLPQGSFSLGFDSSTQSMKATVLDASLNIVAQEIVNFDSELSHYKTKDGVYRDPSVNGRIVSPTIMWVEALDLILERLHKSGLDFGKIVAVSGSGQQHGSVYWKTGSSRVLSSLDPKKQLADQLGDAFSVKESPIWMDSSTTEQCRAIEKAVGGAMELSSLTGSRAYERFTGPQIRRIFETQPEAYKSTERISLVSSFMASLLIGSYAAIDHTDGAGMNLMDIKERAWSKKILEATAPSLEEKLGKLAPAYDVAGQIASYFVERYHFDKNCLVIQWSGDNPNSLAGLTLNSPGDLAISLGTSDTVFAITNEHKACLEGHVFPNPVDTKGYMVMLCYKNGSLTREEIRNKCADKSWDVFSEYLQRTQPLNGGKLGFYYKDHEIIPPLPVGFHRYVLENFKGDTLDGVKETEVTEFDAASEVRALVEGQFLSMRAHAERFGLPSPPKCIIATGGASANDSILKEVASVFGCNVYKIQSSDSASMGAALRAAHGWLCSKKGSFVPISSMYSGKLEKTSLNCQLAVAAGGHDLVSKYGLLMKKRVEIENHLVQKLGRL